MPFSGITFAISSLVSALSGTVLPLATAGAVLTGTTLWGAVPLGPSTTGISLWSDVSSPVEMGKAQEPRQDAGGEVAQSAAGRFAASCEAELARWQGASEHNQVTPSDDPATGFWYSAEVGSSDWPDMWCSEFVGWNLQNAGGVRGETMPATPDGASTYYAFYTEHPELAEIHENDGSYVPRRGDIVLFSGFSHTEMVTEPDGDGRGWSGISGGSEVSAVHRDISDGEIGWFVTLLG